LLTLKEKIAIIEEHTGDNQTTIAKKSKIHQSSFNSMVNRNAEIKSGMIIKICDAYNLNYEWFIKGSGAIFRPEKPKFGLVRDEDVTYQANPELKPVLIDYNNCKSDLDHKVKQSDSIIEFIIRLNLREKKLISLLFDLIK
jgi:hypothetical protein